MKVIIVGAGIGGLTLALELHDAGIECQILEAVSEIDVVGVGINVLPHATKVLAGLGLEQPLAEAGVTTKESVFFNRWGQLIYREPAGRYAGYQNPQFSIHRGDLQAVLLQAVRDRMGADAVVLGRRCLRVEQDERWAGVIVEDVNSAAVLREKADVVVACDGIHSAVRKQFHPDEGAPVYSGVNMWRGVTEWPQFLSGASMVRAGWFDTGKMVIYPIRNAVEQRGPQLVNWVAEVKTANHQRRDWNRRGRVADFIGAFQDWHFDWLDVPAMVNATETVLEYPMVDQEPLDAWSFGRVTLLGDAAHPMVPRGSNGAGQAIVDAHTLSTMLAAASDPVDALKAYQDSRLPATTRVVLANRTTPPDIILHEVLMRTGDRPFGRIDDVISVHELEALSNRYKEIAGYTKEGLQSTAS